MGSGPDRWLLYVLVFLGAFAVTAFGVWALSRLAPALGLVDNPTGRKAHARATPVIGGLAILAGATVAVLLGMVLKDHTAGLMSAAAQHRGFFIGGAILAVAGAWDDRSPIAARYKLLIQLAACVVAVALDNALVGSVRLFINGESYTFGILAGPFTILVMLTITNAINMIDGIDGLAGGICFMAFLIMAKALTAAGFSTAPYLIAAVGAVAAFLMFNFPIIPGRPARVFLGDSGSLLLGFSLAYLAIELSALPNRVFRPSTALWFFFIPVADTIWLYLRRTWAARAPFAPGRDHIHHLLGEFMPMWLVAWVLVGLSGLMAASGYLAERMSVPSIYVIGLWILAFLIYGASTHGLWLRAWKKGDTYKRMMAARLPADARTADDQA